MDAKQLKSIINIGLVSAFVGVLVFFPFKSDYFLTGLLFALCSASLIGGLADSFAVKAIFGQPLRINWPHWLGTNIITRHRKRLVDELVSMVQNELLSPDSIKEALKDKRLSLILQNFLNSENGKQTIEKLLQGAIYEVIQSKRITVLLIGLKRVLSQLSSEAQPSRHVVTIINYIFKHRLDDTIASFLVRMLKPLLQSKAFKSFISSIIQIAIAKYEKDNRRRQVANQLAKIDSIQLTEKLFDYVDQWLFEFMAHDHPFRQKIKQFSEAYVAKITENPDYAMELDKRLANLMQSWLGKAIKGDTLEAWINQIEQAIVSEDKEHQAYRWSQTLITKIENMLTNLSFSTYDEHLLDWLISIIEKKHDVIGKLVNEKLDEYSSEELIELVEDKAGRDLQFIRINGAVVGAIIGGLLFVIQFVVGGVV